MTELHELTALDLGRAIAAGEVSPVEVAEHFLGEVAAATRWTSPPSPVEG